mgnify:FL=1
MREWRRAKPAASIPAEWQDEWSQRSWSFPGANGHPSWIAGEDLRVAYKAGLRSASFWSDYAFCKALRASGVFDEDQRRIRAAREVLARLASET